MWKVLARILVTTSIYAGAIDAVAASGCDDSVPIETDGQRRLALIVGIGKYKANGINSLPGAPADANRFFRLLTGPDGYGFPAGNVCVLLDEKATVGAFRAKFDQLLVQRARPQDVVVVYFAGHGSQLPDRKGDERDDYDETLVFHDSRTGDVGDLPDDDIRAMLLRLHRRTSHVVVVLDSCNSGSATRGDETGTLVRYTAPDPEAIRRGQGSTTGGQGNGRPNLTRENLPGMVVLAAAGDGTAALEMNGAGLFTTALVEAFGGLGRNALTYQQAEKEVRALLSGKTPQIPVFEGNLDQSVFGTAKRGRPLSLQVDALNLDGNKQVKTVSLTGTPPPGLGKNAVLRVYDAKLPRIRVADPTQAKATVVIDEAKGIAAKAHVVRLGPTRQPIEVGDFAVLVQAADNFVQLPVRIRRAGVPGGVPENRATAIRKAVSSREQIRTIVKFVDDPKTPAEFELSLALGDDLELRDVSDHVRVKFRTGDDEAVRVAANLWSHALQRAMLQLRGEGGQDYADNDSLRVSLQQVASEPQGPCQSEAWQQAQPNRKQILPLCAVFRVKLELSAQAPRPLLVGVLLLSSDGKIITISDLKEPLLPGKPEILPRRIRATIPLNVEDYVLAVGTDVTQPIPWQYFSSTDVLTEAGFRGEETPLFSEMKQASPLSSAIYRYVMPGMRGAESLPDQGEDKTWTRTVLPIEVRANSRFFTPRSDSEEVTTREFTLRKFDIRPYLPDAKSSGLYRVLVAADNLTRYAASDGVPYKQHDWSERTDEANLKKGIDCSRAIWYVFKKAGLVYNKDNRFLPTASMVGSTSRMNEYFESCNGKPRQIGDVLVYRNTADTTGHTVMVIDPAQTQRIAWGSHGYDSSAPPGSGREPDKGAEYQKIMSQRDWQRWDRIDMQLKSCWRYRQFAKELKEPGGGPGLQALSKPCDPAYCMAR